MKEFQIEFKEKILLTHKRGRRRVHTKDIENNKTNKSQTASLTSYRKQ
jgi:hypothetical protein